MHHPHGVGINLSDTGHRRQERDLVLHQHVQPLLEHIAAAGKRDPVQVFFRVHRKDILEMHVHPRIIHHRQPKGSTVVKVERHGDAQRIPGAHEHRHGIKIRLEHLGNGVRRDPELQVKALHKDVFAEHNIPVLDDPVEHQGGVFADKGAVFQMVELHRHAGALRPGQPVNRIPAEADDRRRQRLRRLNRGLHRRIIVRLPVAGRAVGLHLQHRGVAEPLVLLCQNHGKIRPFLFSMCRPADAGAALACLSV